MDKQKKKELLGHSLQTLIGICLIIPFFDATSWTRFIALAGFLLIMYNFIWFVRNSEEILYDIFPTKHIREQKPKFRDKIWQHVSMTLFLIGLVFLIFQMDNIENTIEESKFWKTFALIGFVTGILSVFLIKQIRPSVFNESGRRYAVFFGCIVGFSTLITASANYINEAYANPDSSISEYIINSKSSSSGDKSKSYWIFIEIDNSTKRFELKRSLWDKIREGDTVLLDVKTGFFDYEFIENIRLKEVF